MWSREDWEGRSLDGFRTVKLYWVDERSQGLGQSKEATAKSYFYEKRVAELFIKGALDEIKEIKECLALEAPWGDCFLLTGGESVIQLSVKSEEAVLFDLAREDPEVLLEAMRKIHGDEKDEIKEDLGVGANSIE